MAGQTHSADARILNQRTLEKDHKRLAALLRPGVSVLDIGCGTGAITAGIARVAARVVGVDRDAALIAEARASHTAENLTFIVGDLLEFEIEERFDIVNAARVLQWIGDPRAAVLRMAKLAKPRGMVIALDYNHLEHRLDPQPPQEFVRFYHAFLCWRGWHGWDNRMGHNLPALFGAAGLRWVTSTVEDEVTETSLWPHVLESLGPQMVTEGAISEGERREAMEAMREYCATALHTQTLALRAVVGYRTGSRPRVKL